MGNGLSYLLLLRHSAVSVQPSRPAHEWQLSENGRSRCLSFLPHLLPFQPACFITSTETKAVETGQILANGLGVTWQTAADLHEHDRQGTPYLSQSAFQTAIATFFAHPKQLVFGNETADQTQRRMIQAVATILATPPATPLAIVTHGTALTLFLCHYNPEIRPFPFWQSLTLPCAFVLSLPDLKLQHVIKWNADDTGLRR